MVAGLRAGHPCRRTISTRTIKAAKLIPAGSDIVFEMHYTANGKAAGTDQTKVGFVLAKEPPEYRLLTVPVADMTTSPSRPATRTTQATPRRSSTSP